LEEMEESVWLASKEDSNPVLAKAVREREECMTPYSHVSGRPMLNKVLHRYTSRHLTQSYIIYT
jgi:hypothetical protein